MFETPILLIVFNRPNTVRRTFEAIRKIRPKSFFIAGDGPRPGVDTDSQRCAETRAVIELIDWPCNIQTFFRDKNRGCGRGPAEAITWFFQHVEEGIILEDDCLPDPSFFPYCEILLNEYRNDNRIYMISGTNGLKKWKSERISYFFSYMAQSLGWASWRRAWYAFDYKMGQWELETGRERLKKVLPSKESIKYYSAEFTEYKLKEQNDVWDFQWASARWLNRGMTVTPTVNLIRNIGFNSDATHSTDENNMLSNMETYNMGLPLKSTVIHTDWLFDWIQFERFTNPNNRPLLKKIILKLLKYTYQR